MAAASPRSASSCAGRMDPLTAKDGWAQGQNHGSGTTGGDAESGDFTVRRRAIRVRSCALTGDALKAPVVSDAFGQLFNKLDVFEQLFQKVYRRRFRTFAGLRDLIDVKSHHPRAIQDYVHGDGAPFCQCPLTGASFDGSEPFVVVRTTGWLIAQKAISELGEQALQDEYGPFKREDLVAAAPDPDDVREASKALAEKRAAAKAKKKAAKRAKGTAVDAPVEKKKRKVGAACNRRGRRHRAASEGADATGPFTESGARRHVPLGRDELQTGRGDIVRGDGAAATTN